MQKSLANHAGLCQKCTWARVVHSSRGSVFLLCGAHKSTAGMAKYPQLPVLVCAAYAPKPPGQ
ncbi:MAG: hypothetical protein OEZ02_01515 [Anaerolineae bacterium]|nr:hypothetical protein [Anaerolineae bacterium]